MTKHTKARAIGFNHIALEVDDIAEALEFYSKFIDFELRGKSDDMAFIDLGDQFLALQTGRRQPRDDGRNFVLVVSDQDAVRKSLELNGIDILEGPFLDFYDLWGNRVEIVGYTDIQFTKAPHVLRDMGLEGFQKTEDAIQELRDKGMAPDQA